MSTKKELCWTPDPKLLPYVGDREGRGRGGHNFTEVMEQIREKKTGLLSLALGSSQVPSSLSWSPCTLLVTQQPSHINSSGGLARTKAVFLIKPLNLPFCHKTP